jgi:ribosomal protein S4E
MSTIVKRKTKRLCRSVIRQEGVKVNGRLKKGYRFAKGGKVIKTSSKN